jgi:hypothetical protein
MLFGCCGLEETEPRNLQKAGQWILPIFFTLLFLAHSKDEAKAPLQFPSCQNIEGLNIEASSDGPSGERTVVEQS